MTKCCCIEGIENADKLAELKLDSSSNIDSKEITYNDQIILKKNLEDENNTLLEENNRLTKENNKLIALIDQYTNDKMNMTNKFFDCIKTLNKTRCDLVYEWSKYNNSSMCKVINDLNNLIKKLTTKKDTDKDNERSYNMEIKYYTRKLNKLTNLENELNNIEKITDPKNDVMIGILDNNKHEEKVSKIINKTNNIIKEINERLDMHTFKLFADVDKLNLGKMTKFNKSKSIDEMSDETEKKKFTNKKNKLLNTIDKTLKTLHENNKFDGKEKEIKELIDKVENNKKKIIENTKKIEDNKKEIEKYNKQLNL